MSELRHVKRIMVSLWGQRVGTIVPTGTRGETYAFQYDRKFLHSGIEISPLMMPLRKEPYVFADLPRSEYAGLPPAFSDSLPDAFGRGLIDRWLEEKGYVRSEITALDRLAYIGRRAIGALTYEPDHGPGGRPAAFEMRKLVEAARKAANGELATLDGAEALRAILRIGSSVGGAQAKALVGWNRKTDQFLFGDRDLPEGFEHWIIKFTPKEYPWRGPTEYEIYKRARAAGIDISESVLYELDGLGHFMTKRFDRDGIRHHHVQTLSAMAHFPMSVPTEFRTYEQYLATVDALHLGYE
ncbi:MAG: HipA N-terminal domain-containing protein, partial [Kiritimatiellae bacterium]|nr:HipA N-terminal domain-containing protein [Kiritimatiellia bacterium]